MPFTAVLDTTMHVTVCNPVWREAGPGTRAQSMRSGYLISLARLTSQRMMPSMQLVTEAVALR